MTDTYRGRFAPSPTGPLHLGSLMTAAASFLDARAHAGEWRVRIDDLDLPRTVSGASDAILRSLERHGLHWSGAVLRQIDRLPRYEQALRHLDALGLAFHCTCSRSQLADERVYPGTCRGRRQREPEGSAIRVRVPDRAFEFEDRIQGHFTQNLASEVGDFIVRRRDGLIAYQLAVVVDDADQQITHVVRGADLLDNTPRQIFLQTVLDLPRPVYAHLPILTDRRGFKLSKQTGADAVDAQDPALNLATVLDLLGQEPPRGLQREPVAAIIDWAVRHWRTEAVPRTPRIDGFVEPGNPTSGAAQRDRSPDRL